MVESMKKVAGMDVELTVEERNLLSVAYKNVIDQDNSMIYEKWDKYYPPGNVQMKHNLQN